MRTLLSFIFVLTLALSARAQVYQLAGSQTTFSNQLITSAAPLNTYTLPQRTLYLQHGALLTTTNGFVMGQVGIVDALTGLTNWTYVAQNGNMLNTNATTETVVVTNEYFSTQYRLVVTTTNVMNPALSTNTIGVIISVGP